MRHKKNAKKEIIVGSLLLIICLTFVFTAFAHKGRTDSNGGHRDNDNSSGLGSYHFHCGGYPAHLHTNGVCPYTSRSSSSSSSYSTSKSNSSSSSYSVGYDKGYDEGYDEGYEKGHKKGYNEGLNKKTKGETRNTIILLSIAAIIVITLFVRFVKFLNRKRKE